MFSGNEWLVLMIGLLPIALIVALVVFLASRSSTSAPTSPHGPDTFAGGGSTPAGWFPDPARRHQYRYWDGGTWTQHVTDNAQPAIDPL